MQPLFDPSYELHKCCLSMDLYNKVLQSIAWTTKVVK